MTIKQLNQYQKLVKAEKEAKKRKEREYKKLVKKISCCNVPTTRKIMIEKYIHGKEWSNVEKIVNLKKDECIKAVEDFLKKIGH